MKVKITAEVDITTPLLQDMVKKTEDPIRSLREEHNDVIELSNGNSVNQTPLTYSANTLNTESVQLDLLLTENTPIDNETQNSKKLLIIRLLASTILGLGTGLAMLPIFNNEIKELENFGIDVHDNRAVFATSTVNTLLVTSFVSVSGMYHFLKENHDEVTQELSKIAKIGVGAGLIAAACSAILPLGMLWEVELHDQQVAESGGFDEYIAWAAFTSLPLFISRIAEGAGVIKNLTREEEEVVLDSMGSKLFVYGTALLSAVGRGISYTAAGYSLCIYMGADEEVALTLSIPLAGMVGSAVGALADYQAIKSLYAKQQGALSVRQGISGVFSALEGGWASLPLISTGMDFVESWNPLIKGGLFVPLFVSNSILEATRIYNSIQRLK